MKAIIGLMLLACLAARPATAQRIGVEFRPLQPPPALATPATPNLPDSSDYAMEGALIGGVGVGLFGVWFAREFGSGPLGTVLGGLAGATIGVTIGGMIGSGIRKAPCCRDEPEP
jgi:hypothetical protein